MIHTTVTPDATVDDTVRTFIFTRAAASGAVPQAREIAESLGLAPDAVDAALKRLAEGKVLVLAPNGGDIWAANPFCAVPSGFRVDVGANRYWGICIWDALGVVAALRASSASIRATCGDCGEILRLEVQNGQLARWEGLIHFAVPARGWWRNIGFA